LGGQQSIDAIGLAGVTLATARTLDLEHFDPVRLEVLA
jgi:hypothetical protein